VSTDAIAIPEDEAHGIKSVPSAGHLTSGPASPYAPYWHPIAPSSAVTDKPARFMLLGEALVAFRTSEGLGVFKDLCVHRGAPLSMGWVENDRITCPYHGFQYDITGRCRRIPSIPEDQGIPKKVNAIAYQSQDAYGLVWVALAEPVAPIMPWPEFADPDWRALEPLHYSWNASAGRIVENYLDAAHFPFVHDGLLGKREDTLIDPYHHTLERTERGLTFYLDQEEPAAPDTDEGEKLRLTYTAYMPFVCQLVKTTSRGETHVPLFVCPKSDTESDLFCPILRNVDREPEQDDGYVYIVDTAAKEDKVIVESQRPEQLPLDLAEEMHIKVPDAAGVLYRRLLRDVEAGVFAATG
jgi:phenylpropionate dioxygenase-like ring-hydroxylating dioxygenase large terminal subunit